MADRSSLRQQCESDSALDVPVLQPSPTAITLSFAASFYRDAQACRGTQELARVYRDYRDKILSIDKLAANIAAAFRPLLRNGLPPSEDMENDAQQWKEFDALAQKVHNSRDRESQHLRHQSGIIAIWGPVIFQHYGWQVLPLDLMRKLHDLALLIPRWEDVVHLLNSRMLARHEQSVLRGNNNAYRIGQHSTGSKVQDPQSPVERKDILSALDWARRNATPAETRKQIQDLKKSTRSINGTPIKEFRLNCDRYGMVIPVNAKDYPSHAEISDRPAKRLKLATTSAFSPSLPDVSSTPTPLRRQNLPRSRNASRNASSRSTSVASEEEHAMDDDTDDDEVSLHAGGGRVQRLDSSELRIEDDEDHQERSTRAVGSQASELGDGHRESSIASGAETVCSQTNAEAEGYADKEDIQARQGANREYTDAQEMRGEPTEEAGINEGQTEREYTVEEDVGIEDAGPHGNSGPGSGKDISGETVLGAIVTQQEMVGSHPEQQRTRKSERLRGATRNGGSGLETAGAKSLPDQANNGDLAQGPANTSRENDSSGEHASSDVARAEAEEGEAEEEDDEADRDSSEAHANQSSAPNPIGRVSSTNTSLHLTTSKSQDGSKQFASNVRGQGVTNATPIQEADGSGLKRNANDRTATSRRAWQGEDPKTPHNDRNSPQTLASLAPSSRRSSFSQHSPVNVDSAGATQGRQGLHGNSESDILMGTLVEPVVPLQQISELDSSALAQAAHVRNTSTAYLPPSTNTEKDPTPFPAPLETERFPPNTGIQCESHTPAETLLQSIQSRHTLTVQSLIREASQPHPESTVMQQRRLQLDWLRPQRWASIYAEPEDLLGKSSAPSEEADIWYLSWGRFRHYADSGYVFRCPVVIKQAFLDSGMYNLEEYMEMLWQRFPGHSIDIQNSQTGDRSPMAIPDYCLAVSKLDLTSPDAVAPVSNAMNLGHIVRADEPLLTRLTRFRLLSTLIDRTNGVVGKKLRRKPTDIDSSLHFNLLALTGAFSGSLMDFVGTWARCLVGRKVWMIAPNVDADDWQHFADEGRHWSPQGKGRIVVLEQDDVLLMPPGLPVIHSFFTPEPCLMEGGILWDECSIPEILEGLTWIAKNPACTNEAIAYQMPELIDTLEQWFDENHVHMVEEEQDSQYQDAIKAGIAKLRSLGCNRHNGYKAPGS